MEILKPNVQETKEELSETDGIMEDVRQEEVNIEAEFMDVVLMNPKLRPIFDKMEKLVKQIERIEE